MFFNRNYINRALAGALLFTLIFIHGVKLLHNHSFNQFSSNQITLKTGAGNTDHFTLFHISANCDICNYQLAKDADHFVLKTSSYSRLFIDNFSQLNSFQKLSPFSSFESRGPPNNI